MLRSARALRAFAASLCFAFAGCHSGSSPTNPAVSAAGPAVNAASPSPTGASSASPGSAGSTGAATAPTSSASAGLSSGPACAGTAAAPGASDVVVNACASIAPISADQLGTNLGIWYNVTTPSLPSELAQVQAHILRWPGGSLSDTYHWQNHTQCNGGGSSYTSGPADDPSSTFDNFMNSVVIAGGYDAAVTVDYGTNAACNGGGDPAEAAAWVSYVKQSGWDSHVRYWTVGNEEFGGWEVDLHGSPHDPTTYAAAMSGPNGYYALMKAADANAQVGVVVDGTGGFSTWDSTVLARAPYDFVEIHWYAQQPGSESDSYLIDQAPADFVQTINNVKSELAAAGKPNTPIMVGEMNSVAYAQGKQTVSIVNALFAAQVLVEGIKNGLSVDTWWFGDGGTQGCANNDSSSLYGFQNWGGYDLVFGNTAENYNNC